MSQRILFRRLAFYKLHLFYSPYFFQTKTHFLVYCIIKALAFLSLAPLIIQRLYAKSPQKVFCAKFGGNLP